MSTCFKRPLPNLGGHLSTFGPIDVRCTFGNAWNIQPESIKLVWVLSEFFLWSYGPKTSEKHEKYKFTVVLALFTKFDSRQKLWNFQPESIKLVWDDLELFR